MPSETSYSVLNDHFETEYPQSHN